MEHMDCQEAREEFGALLDDELTVQRREAIEAHLGECSLCLRDLESLQRTDRLYQRLERKTTPETFERDVYDAAHPSIFRRRRVKRSMWPLIAAAAVMAVTAGTLFTLLLRQPNRFEMAAAPEAPAPQLRGEGGEPYLWMPFEGKFEPIDVGEDASVRSMPTAVSEDLPSAVSERPAATDDGSGVPEAGIGLMSGESDIAMAQPAPEAQSEAMAEAMPETMPLTTEVPITFERVEGVWIQEGYAGEPVTVLATSADVEALELDQPLRDQLNALEPPIVFVHDGKWFRINGQLTMDNGQL
jgi:predicted anti-sigma-YlaC factor YlaD